MADRTSDSAVAERSSGAKMEECFLTLYTSPNSPTYGKKHESAVGAGFSFLRAGRQANRILRARGIADSEATPTPTKPGSLIQTAPRSEASSTSSWWPFWNPLKLSAEERRLAADKTIVSGQRQSGTSSSAGSSAHESVKSAPSDPPPVGYRKMANGTFVWQEICDPLPSKLPTVSRYTQDLRDAITRSNNAFAMSYVQRPARLEDYADVDPGCARWEPQPLRDDPPVSDGRLHFFDEKLGDVSGDVVHDPHRQAREPGESFTQAKFHQPIFRRQ